VDTADAAVKLNRLLIANRGEIAVRIIATCERLGIETVLAASTADTDSMAARRADRTICIGPAPASASYLDVTAVIRAARETDADAIHPGYGFLSENPRLAAACAENSIVFVGPTVSQLEAVGDKLLARAHAHAAGLPIVPGGRATCGTPFSESSRSVLCSTFSSRGCSRSRDPGVQHPDARKPERS